MADAERPKIESLRAEIHKGLNCGPAEPLDMNEIETAARQQRKSLSDALAKFAKFSPLLRG